MKPTKEQLADPKWWDENSNGYNYAFYLEKIGRVKFADESGNSKDFGLIIGQDAWQLLAKRPEQWVPEVGVDCIQKMGGGDRKVSITYVGNGVGCYYDYKNEMEYTFSMRDSVFVPIKTQREEFVEEAKSRIKNMDADDIILAGKLYDAGCRFDLTKKDGE